jgi:predicted dehydrogenase
MWRLDETGRIGTGKGECEGERERESRAMASSVLRIGIAGCGYAAQVHLDRLLAIDAVQVVGCADTVLDAARALAARVPVEEGGSAVAAFSDHKELIRQLAPDALAVFTPHLAHYRIAMDALQADCHLFIEKPLTTNLQEAVDVAGLARGRNLKVGVGHQFRLRPSLAEARRRVSEGAIGPVRLVTATLAQPWLSAHHSAENLWRFDPNFAGGGMLADAGDHMIDALLWTTGQVAVEASAVQCREASGLDVVTAAALRLADGTAATLGLSGVSASDLFELKYFGERGWLRATDTLLEEETVVATRREVPLPEPSETIDGNFVSAVVAGTPLCCPADQALETVRLLEGIARSAATGQVVRLS